MTDHNYLPGCYIDGHHGHFGTPAMLRLAIGAGFKPTDDDTSAILARYGTDQETDDDTEALVWVADRAEQWLNDTYPLAGHSWRWDDGEFGLYPDDDDA